MNKDMLKFSPAVNIPGESISNIIDQFISSGWHLSGISIDENGRYNLCFQNQPIGG